MNGDMHNYYEPKKVIQKILNMPDISKTQLKERKKWFSEWLPRVETKLSNWIISLPEEDQNALNFSPESLNHIEALMLKQFPTNEYAFSDLANSTIIDLYGTYIGETFRKNHCIELTWVCDLLGAGYDTWVNFHPFLTSKYANCGQIMHMQYVIHQRTGDKLIKQYLAKEKIFSKAVRENDLTENYAPIIDRGYSYQHFILCQSNDYPISHLKNEIESYNRIRKRTYQIDIDNNQLTLKVNEDYNFYFQIDKSEGVKDESREIAESYKGEIDPILISKCAIRIEFWGDEDISVDYFNESLFILEHMEKDKNLLIYNLTSGNFF